jgi:hypothetical protein
MPQSRNILCICVDLQLMPEHVYHLPEWYDSPQWWKTFVLGVMDAHPSGLFIKLVNAELAKWNMKRVGNNLVCDTPETFAQFVLAHS